MHWSSKFTRRYSVYNDVGLLEERRVTAAAIYKFDKFKLAQLMSIKYGW